MKILQVFDLFSLSYGGGTVDVVSKLSRALQNRGHEVTLCTSDYKLDRPDINTLVYHSWLNRSGMYITPNVVSLNVRAFDVVHLHCYRSFQNAVICQKAMKHGVPYIIDAHGSTVDLNGTKQIVRKLYDKIIGYKTLANAGKLIAETEIGVSEYKKLGVDEHKIALLHPFLDTSEFSDLPPKGLFKYMHRIDGKLVIFLGRIHRNKGIDILVKAIAQLPDVVLAVVGQNDGFMDTLDILILEQGIRNRVLFTGYLGGRDKLSAIVDADVLIQPSMNEAGARPSLEAILCGTPIIVTKNTGAGKEISKFDGGYLVDYGDVEGLTQAIKHILYNNGEAWIKTHKARAYIQENLSLESQIVKYEELYRSVI